MDKNLTLDSLISYIMVGLQTPRKKHQTHKKSKDFTEDISETSDLCLETQRLNSGLLKILKVKNSLKDKKEEIIKKVKTRYQKLNKTLHQTNFIKSRDKFVFTFTCMNVGLGSFLLGKYPCYFPYYYIICALTLIPTRFINYRIQKYHYFLLDFCYYANMTGIIYLYFYPLNELLFNLFAAFAFGPLLIAVPLFTNSFVPHSVDKITSLVIHVLPGITLWSLKTGECEGFNMNLYPPSDFYMYATGAYFTWLSVYYLIIFCLTFERCVRKGNVTLYRWAMEDHTTLTYAYTGLLGERFRPLLFVSQHAISNLVLFFIAYVLVLNYWVLTLALFCVVSWSTWNGATYYIDLFSRKYEKDLQKIEEIYSNLAN